MIPGKAVGKCEKSMIELTKLNKEKYFINSELIETIEMIPDTLITMTNGKKHYVLESARMVISKIEAFKVNILFCSRRMDRRSLTYTTNKDLKGYEDWATEE